MDFSRIAPWNWFKNEQITNGNVIPVNKKEAQVDSTRRTSQYDIDELFSNIQKSFNSLFQHPMQVQSTFGNRILKPFLDIEAKEHNYLIQVELPGVDKKDINIHVEDEMLIIEGEKKQEEQKEDKNYYAVERFYGSFRRVLDLPSNSDIDKITSTFKDGVLTIEIPKLKIEKKDIKRISIS